MEIIEFKAKTVEEAITNALLELGTTSDNIEYEVQDYEILDSINKLNIYQKQEINHLDYLIYELLLKIKQIEGRT